MPLRRNCKVRSTRRKNLINQADDGFKHLFDDPVLQKNPSATLALKQYLSGVLGPLPTGESHLAYSQKQLQVQGFGKDLQANGVNSPGWNAAFAQWRQQVYQSQLSGKGPGSLTLAHAMDALNAITPTSAWNALVGYVKQLPNGARQLLGDAVGGTAQLGADLIDPHYYATGKSNSQVNYNVNSAVVNALGGDTSPQAIQTAYKSQGALRFLEDASNLIMFGSIAGAATRFGAAAATETAASTDAEAAAALTKDAAFKGPGTLANTLAGANGESPIIPRMILGGVLGGGGVAAAGGSPGQIALGGLAGGGVGALSTTSLLNPTEAPIGGLEDTNVFKNIPVLGRTGPFIEGLADADGLYYKIREFVHQPYSWVLGPDGAVSPIQGAIGTAARLGDTAFNQSLMLGGEARALAQAQDWVGGDGSSNFSKSIESTHTLDSVNDAISQRLGVTVLGQHIAPSLDDLMFLFGGKGAEALKTSGSTIIGQQVDKVIGAGTDAIVSPGFGGGDLSHQRQQASEHAHQTGGRSREVR